MKGQPVATGPFKRVEGNGRTPATCWKTGKRRYKSLTSAENALRDLILHGSERQVVNRAYPCEFCKGYHLTHKRRHQP